MFKKQRNMTKMNFKQKHKLADARKRQKVVVVLSCAKCGWELQYSQSLFLSDAFSRWQAGVIYQRRVQESFELGKLWISHSLKPLQDGLGC